MINEHSSTQANTSTSANMQYGYPTNRFDLMNMSPMQNPNDLYSYYPTSLYQPFGTFDEHNQWSPTDTSNTILTSGPLQYHPQMYPPSGVDISRNLFDYSHHTYSPYHPVFTPSTGDMSWNPHNLSLQQQQPIPLISNKTSSVYDEYPSNSGGGGDVGNMLAQHMNSINLGNNDTNNLNILSSKEQQQQQQYQLNSSNFSLTRPSGPKSYASVVSSDIINSISNKSTPSISNSTIYSTSNDSSNTQQTRHNRYQQQSSVNGNLLNWTNKNSERSLNTKLSRTDNNNQYNPKDFNLNPKGARFFVIKSYSEDDVHRSIKYNIWCSTEHGNKRLDAAFREREGKGPIYLFFSVNASGHFCGMAEMISPLDYEHQTDVWQMSNKWQGKFEVKWIYVKDVPNQQFRNIRLENNDNKPVTNSRDTQEIPYEKGKLMLKTMHMYRDKTSIFDDFQYYESKQAEETTTAAASATTTTTTKKSSNNDFNNNTNHSRGNNTNKRQYSSNKTSANQSEQQQQQQQQNDGDIN